MPESPEIVPLPVDEERSLYANDFAVWRSSHDVALDLRVVGPVDVEEGARVASPVVRVRLPVTMIFAMVTALLDEHFARQDEADR